MYTRRFVLKQRRSRLHAKIVGRRLVERRARRREGGRIVHAYRATGGLARIGELLERSLRRVTPSDVKFQQRRQHSSRHVLGKLFESRLDALHEYAGCLEPRHALQTAEKVQPERRVHLVRVYPGRPWEKRLHVESLHARKKRRESREDVGKRDMYIYLFGCDLELEMAFQGRWVELVDD